MSDSNRIGLISDTHGLLRPEALRAFRGSDLILHAGDLGNPKIVDELQRIAPVIAVRGNIDQGEWADRLPPAAEVACGGARIYMIHDLKTLNLDPAAAGFRIVVSGHSHKPSRSERAGVLYLNPGSAGPRRFRLPLTVALLDVEKSPWAVKFVDLLAEP